MSKIIYIDRLTKQLEEEKVYKGRALELLYGSHWFHRLFGATLLPLLVKYPFFSAFYGYLQKRARSAKKIIPFIQEFGIDPTEFQEPISQFRSFNDFFIRKLKKKARPIAEGETVAVMPVDGRYYFYQSLEMHEEFVVKSHPFNLASLLESETLAQEYRGGSLVIARLCPSDYHRFHFPIDCVPGETRLINGWVYSVNPMAIKRDIHIFTKNKRTLCLLDSKRFGQVLYLEVGATAVGSIRQTYTPFVSQVKGAEKGYFEFGASSLIILFKPGIIRFDSDLLEATQQGLEIRCLMGQRMGECKN